MIVDKIKKRETKSFENKKSHIDIPIGKWIKCENCKEIVYKETVRNNFNICPNCGHYFRMHIGRRLKQIFYLIYFYSLFFLFYQLSFMHFSFIHFFFNK